MRRVEKEIEAERQELQQILGDRSSYKTDRLAALARRVGASTQNPYHEQGLGNDAQITQAIHQALQTKSTVAALRISRGYLVVSIILSAVSGLSMLAAWVAVLINWWHEAQKAAG